MLERIRFNKFKPGRGVKIPRGAAAVSEDDGPFSH